MKSKIGKIAAGIFLIAGRIAIAMPSECRYFDAISTEPCICSDGTIHNRKDVKPDCFDNPSTPESVKQLNACNAELKQLHDTLSGACFLVPSGDASGPGYYKCNIPRGFGAQ
jgi:hypothetical protein